jgi:Ni,Fe-hydrogenase I small subunit
MNDKMRCYKCNELKTPSKIIPVVRWNKNSSKKTENNHSCFTCEQLGNKKECPKYGKVLAFSKQLQKN